MTTTRFACVIADILYILFSLKFSMFLDGIRPPRIGPAAKGALPLVGNLRCQRMSFTPIIACLAHRIKPDFDTECIRDGFLLQGSPILWPYRPPVQIFIKRAGCDNNSRPASHAVSSFARAKPQKAIPCFAAPCQTPYGFSTSSNCDVQCGQRVASIAISVLQYGHFFVVAAAGASSFYGPRRPTCSFP